jgi:hypothetical protein
MCHAVWSQATPSTQSAALTEDVMVVVVAHRKWRSGRCACGKAHLGYGHRLTIGRWGGDEQQKSLSEAMLDVLSPILF